MAIHPGSGSPQKNWPTERWIVVARQLFRIRGNLRLMLLGGEADSAEVAAMRRALPPERVLMVENAPLPRVAALLARCEFYLGHDSGNSHLAAATGIPCVVLFGPTDPSVWSPPQPKVNVIRGAGDGLSAISVESVLSCLDPRG